MLEVAFSSQRDRLALTHQQLPHALRLPTQHLYFWRHGVLKKETQSGMPSAGLAITPYKTKNVYVPMDTHRLQTPPPPLSEQVCHVRAQRAGVCVRVRIARARACELYARARTRRTRTARAHCTCSPYARAVREPYARTVRKKCAHTFSVQSASTVRAYGTYSARARRTYVHGARARAVPYGHRTRGPYVQKTQQILKKTQQILKKTQQILNKTQQILAHTFCVQSGRTVRVRYVQCARAVRTYSARAPRVQLARERARTHRTRARARAPYRTATTRVDRTCQKSQQILKNRNRFSRKGSRF